jgi:hypothetical protein
MKVPEGLIAEAVTLVVPLRDLFDVTANPEIQKALDEAKTKKLVGRAIKLAAAAVPGIIVGFVAVKLAGKM